MFTLPSLSPHRTTLPIPFQQGVYSGFIKTHCVSLLPLSVPSTSMAIYWSKLDPRGAAPLKKANSPSPGSYSLPIANYYYVIRISYSSVGKFYFFLTLILKLENLFLSKLMTVPLYIFFYRMLTKQWIHFSIIKNISRNEKKLKLISNV